MNEGTYNNPHHTDFEDIYHTYVDDIFRFCMSKVSNRDVALDITQEVFVSFWQYIDRGETIEHPRGLLYRIARSRIIDHHRKSKSQSLDHLLEEGSEFNDETSNEYTDEILAREGALKILGSLPNSARELLVMRFFDELPVKDIAEILDISANSASVKIHRALKLAQEKLDASILDTFNT